MSSLVSTLRHLLIYTALLFACAPGVYADGGDSDADVQKNSRFLYLDGVVTGGTIAPLQAALTRVIESESREPVTLLINSPGGSVIAGMSFINRMQTVLALDIEINCYVLDMAASMAFQILTQCTNRYALPGSFLLWHGVRMGTSAPITTQMARMIAEDLQRMDDLVMQQLTTALHLEPSVISYHFDRETLWTGMGLQVADPGFLELRDAYPELLSQLDLATRTAPMSFFRDVDGIQYIWSEYPLTRIEFNTNSNLQE